VHHSNLVAHECGHNGDNSSDERARKDARAQQDHEARYPTHHPQKSVLQVSLEDSLCSVRNTVLAVVIESEDE